jgi:hypothetical protein
MNNGSEKKAVRRFRWPGWLSAEWVFQGLLTILVMPVAINALLSLGVDRIA